MIPKSVLNTELVSNDVIRLAASRCVDDMLMDEDIVQVKKVIVQLSKFEWCVNLRSVYLIVLESWVSKLTGLTTNLVGSDCISIEYSQ